jgi:NADPH2:quinone reductase
MRAAWLTEWGGPSKLRVVDRTDLKPSPDEVIIDVKAAAINYPDILMLANRYQVSPTLPFTPGSEFAGIVRAVGEQVTKFAVGDRVGGGVLTGAFAEQVSVAAKGLYPLPEQLDWTSAAAYRVASLTAYHALVTFGEIGEIGEIGDGSTVIVLGAAGGVGSATVNIARMLGAHVIAVVSTSEKAEFAIAQGASEAVLYRDEDLRQRLKDLVPNGADIVVDPVGGPCSEPALRALRWGGRFVVVGFAAGEIPRIPLNLVLLKGVQIRGFELRTLADHRPDAVAQAEEDVRALIDRGWRPAIDSTYPLERTSEALERVASGAVMGKLVITMG